MTRNQWELERSRIWYNCVEYHANHPELQYNGERIITNKYADMMISCWDQRFPKPMWDWRMVVAFIFATGMGGTIGAWATL